MIHHQATGRMAKLVQRELGMHAGIGEKMWDKHCQARFEKLVKCLQDNESITSGVLLSTKQKPVIDDRTSHAEPETLINISFLGVLRMF